MAIHKIQIPGATSAEAINAHALVVNEGTEINAGNSTQPVYFKDGIPVVIESTPLLSVPIASDATIGGFKTGYTASGKNYPIQVNTNGQAYVNVPWTDTNTDTNTWRTIKVNGADFLTDNSTALNFSVAGFSTVTGSSGTVTFDTKIRKVASLAEATDTSCVYLIPSSSGNLQQSYIIASSAPSDTTKIWIDSANSNIAKVWNGSAWSTLGAVWS